MGGKRKRSFDTLVGDTLSNNYNSKIHKVDLNTALQDLGSSDPSTSFDTHLHWPTLISESPPSSESSQASSQRFPLTKHNLHQFNRIMASNLNTPDNKSRKSKTTTTSTSETVRSVRKALAQNNIYIDDSDAAEARGADLIENARAIVKGDRQSALK